MASSSLSPERVRLLELSRDRGASLSSLSDLLGRNSAYLQQFIKRGTPRKLEEEDRRTLAQFFGVDEAELCGARGKSFETKSAKGSGNWVSVPRLDICAAAGAGALPTCEETFDTFRFSDRWLAEQGLKGADLSAITVKGDSMEPLLCDGDEILVDLHQQPLRDGVHVVRLGDTLLVKRVARSGSGTLSLLSQNPAYPPIEVSPAEIEIIGRVVWKGGRI